MPPDPEPVDDALLRRAVHATTMGAAMSREVRDVTQRCRDCGAATAVLLDETGIADDGTDYRAIWSERVPHSRSDCSAVVTLMREQWPTLW